MKWERGKKGEMDRVSKKHEKHNAHILKSKWIVNHLVSKSIKHLLKSEIIIWKGVKDRDNGKQTNEKEQKRNKWRTVLTTQQQFNKCSLCFQGFLPDDGCFHIKMIRFFILSRNLLKTETQWREMPEDNNVLFCPRTAFRKLGAEAAHHFCTPSLNQLLYPGRESGLNTQQCGWTQTSSCQVK